MESAVLESEPKSSGRQDVTGCLARWRRGDPRALDDLVPLVYSELRRLAQSHLQSERADITLQATELVHEAYFRLAGKDHPDWTDRAHFFAVAGLVIRRILVDHARKKATERRGGGWVREPLEDQHRFSEQRATTLLAIDRLLDELASTDLRKSRIVEMRFFAGMTIRETAEALGVTPMTVGREWRVARAWMTAELRGSTDEGEDAPRGGS